jgi:hypothetical protein
MAARGLSRIAGTFWGQGQIIRDGEIVYELRYAGGFLT